jgi:YesN/AraC family two-component response regulator
MMRSFKETSMKKKILIVEDEFVVANDLEIMLTKAGYESVGIAASVNTAMEKMTNNIPDLVLLDIKLQGALTGIDFAKILRTENKAFIYLSANSNDKTFEAAKNTSPYGFLVKPFRERDVLAMIEIACHLHETIFDEAKNDHEEKSDNADRNATFSKKEKEVVSQFMEHLNKHFVTKKLVSDYADDLCISPNYLNTIIKKVTGFPVSHHIQQCIIREAKCRALQSGAMMKEIAYDLGFNDLAHFSKFFKNYSGTSFSSFMKGLG